MDLKLNTNWRKTDQKLLPVIKQAVSAGQYDIYPSFKLRDDRIYEGFESLTDVVASQKTVIIDGYTGVFFDQFRDKLDECIKNRGIKTFWKNTSDFLKSPEAIEAMISPFTGGDDPLFGKRTDLIINDFEEFIFTKYPEIADIKNSLYAMGAVFSSMSGSGSTVYGIFKNKPLISESLRSMVIYSDPL